jgi:glutamate dehydrogenase (NADP+)
VVRLCPVWMELSVYKLREINGLLTETTIFKHSQGMLGAKGVQWGPSNLRPEATGYGVVFYAKEVLADLYKDLKGV